MVVLGIDPGYAIVGYGLIRYENNRLTPLQYGVIRTHAKLPIEDRLHEIFTDLTKLIDAYKPDAMAVEKLYFNTNEKTAIDVSQARGIIVLTGKIAGVPFAEYTPLQVKMSVAGYGKADKVQVTEMTRRLLGLRKVPKPDDAADALAIAICHAHTAGSGLNNI
ncbi:MAG: crossover junction endodeoxyribonuclease RuvC [Clostridiales bacterium]|jgi:crossover junction endodeoxyribonuclease RuvC|nr:crossover junction endodeoxyribonuclease RuvC [Clostridiales bacterium]